MRLYSAYRTTEFPTEHYKARYMQDLKEFDRLRVLGENNISVKRKGAWRKYNRDLFNAFDFDDMEIQKHGIHPLEVQLLARAEENRMKEINCYDYYPSKSFLVTERTSRVSTEELNLVGNERDSIEKDWSDLNIKLLDQFYEDQVKYTDMRDFVFILKDQGHRFPNCLGDWFVRSKKWITESNGQYAYGSVSKNEALYYLLQIIDKDNKKCLAPLQMHELMAQMDVMQDRIKQLEGRFDDLNDSQPNGVASQ